MWGVNMSTEHVLYTALAEYYDVIYREYLERIVPRMIDFVEEVFRRDAKRPVRRILDIACGTGGPTLELARRGYSVVGLDLHEEMLRIAREKAKRLGLSVEFMQGDAREMEFEEEFDAVTMFFSSLPYMTTWDDLIKLLKAVYRALKPGGVFVADETNPYYMARVLGRHAGPVVWDVRHGEETIVLIDFKELEDVTGVLWFKRLILILKPDGSVRAHLMSDKLRSYTAQELKLACKEVGFEFCRVYGDMRVTEEEPTSARRLFLVARK